VPSSQPPEWNQHLVLVFQISLIYGNGMAWCRPHYITFFIDIKAFNCRVRPAISSIQLNKQLSAWTEAEVEKGGPWILYISSILAKLIT